MAYGKKSVTALEIGDILTCTQGFTSMSSVPATSYTAGQTMGVVTKIDTDIVYFSQNGTEHSIFKTVLSNSPVSVKYSANSQYNYPDNPNGTWWSRNSGLFSNILSVIAGVITGKASASATVNNGSGQTTTIDTTGNITTKDQAAADAAAAATALKQKQNKTILILVIIVAVIGAAVFFIMKARKKKLDTAKTTTTQSTTSPTK